MFVAHSFIRATGLPAVLVPVFGIGPEAGVVPVAAVVVGGEIVAVAACVACDAAAAAKAEADEVGEFPGAALVNQHPDAGTVQIAQAREALKPFSLWKVFQVVGDDGEVEAGELLPIPVLGVERCQLAVAVICPGREEVRQVIAEEEQLTWLHLLQLL